MRYTVDNTPRPAKVYLNGQPVTSVVEADTGKGKVVRYRDGCPLDKYRKRILTETLHGDVRVECTNGLQPGSNMQPMRQDQERPPMQGMLSGAAN